MPCLFAVIALLAPRVLTVVLWLFTDWFAGLFSSLLWPILGFIFAPTTLLWYSVVHNVYGGEWGTLQIVVMVIAVLIDLSPANSRRKG
ncbi:MAG: hypothetical protein D6685_17315 [Bacteroidetes bacterium]|nr:MAG: hypothetical protein D6685_17315 [Bacteroidota bacterium]